MIHEVAGDILLTNVCVIDVTSCCLTLRLKEIAENHLVARGITPGEFVSGTFQQEQMFDDGMKLSASWVMRFVRNVDPLDIGPHIVVIDADTLDPHLLVRM